MYIFDSNKVTHIKSIGFKNNGKSFRFFLEIETTSTVLKTAIIIMKNPAKACMHHLCINKNITPKSRIESDSTVNHIIDKLYTHYNRIVVLNLYPYMTSDTSIANKFYSNVDHKKMQDFTNKKNRFVVISTLKQYHADIFCAWGQESSLSVSMYSETIYNFIAYCFRRHIELGEYDSSAQCLWIPLKNIFPVHASKW